jgi:hypothetical protein
MVIACIDIYLLMLITSQILFRNRPLQLIRPISIEKEHRFVHTEIDNNESINRVIRARHLLLLLL